MQVAKSVYIVLISAARRAMRHRLLYSPKRDMGDAYVCFHYS
jgi:hypothetical protein